MKQYQRARRSTNRRGSFSMHLHNAMQKEVDCRAVWKKTDIYRCNADHEGECHKSASGCLDCT